MNFTVQVVGDVLSIEERIRGEVEEKRGVSKRCGYMLDGDFFWYLRSSKQKYAARLCGVVVKVF